MRIKNNLKIKEMDRVVHTPISFNRNALIHGFLPLQLKKQLAEETTSRILNEFPLFKENEDLVFNSIIRLVNVEQLNFNSKELELTFEMFISSLNSEIIFSDALVPSVKNNLLLQLHSWVDSKNQLLS